MICFTQAAVVAQQMSTRLRIRRSWVWIPLGAGLFLLLPFPTFLHQSSALNEVSLRGASLTVCCCLGRNRLNKLRLGKKYLPFPLRAPVFNCLLFSLLYHGPGLSNCNYYTEAPRWSFSKSSRGSLSSSREPNESWCKPWHRKASRFKGLRWFLN